MLCSASQTATADYLQKCTDPDKASITVHYLTHACDLLSLVATLGDPNVRLPDLEAEEFEPFTGGGEGEQGEIEFVELEDGAAAAAEPQS